MFAVVELSVALFSPSYFEMSYVRMVISIYVGEGTANA